MKTKIFAYVRVSSKDQNEGRQFEEMKKIGIDERNIFIDKVSGKDFNRPQYKALIQCLREGDLIYIKSIDRFGRNSKEIKKEWENITQEIKADIKVIDMPLLDTTQYKDTLGTFVSDLVLQVLAFVAERERENIKQRQAEGIALVKKLGKTKSGNPYGRPKAKFPVNWNSYYTEWKEGKMTATSVIFNLNIKRNTFYNLVKRYELDNLSIGKITLK